MSEPKRQRLLTWDDPLALTARVQGLSGLEVLAQVVRGELPQWPMTRLMGLMLAEVEPGRAVVEATPAEWHYNPSGVVHGGFAATLLDTAVGCAVFTTMAAGESYTTVELKVNYLKPVTIATGRVRGTGTVLHRGGRTAMAEGRLEDAAGVLLAHATTTCLLFTEPARNARVSADGRSR